jgi:AcrR family transcriptional regulator
LDEDPPGVKTGVKSDRGAPLSKASPRDRILLVGKEFFATHGYENTSTAAIARTARTSESQIIKHFGSKEGLLEAIFEDGWTRIAEAFGAIEYLPSPSAKLQALAGLILTKLEEDARLKQLFLLEGRRIRKEGHMVLMTKGYLNLIGTIDVLLTEMRKAGQLRPELHVEAIRSTIVGMMEGLLRDKILSTRAGYPASFSSEDIRKLFLHVLQSFSAPALKMVTPARARS